MRDALVLAFIIGSIPICIMRPYYGVLLWYFVTYFNPHRFTWGMAYNFPVATCVAVPTLVGVIFGKKTLSSLGVRESVFLFLLWVWFAVSWIYSMGIPLFFSEGMDRTNYEANHIGKIFLFTFVMIVLVNTRERLRGLMLVTGGSLGLLAIKGAVFGLRTSGDARVWGPPDSFLADNNAFGLALNMALPILYFLAREEKRKWLRNLLYIAFLCSVAVVLLTYSRGALLGLAAVLLVILMRSRKKFFGAIALTVAALLVLTFAPASWMDRMGDFAHGKIDSSAEERLVSWGTAWNLAKDYPLTGGSFDSLHKVGVFQRYKERPLPFGYLSSGPHSIYFQLMADQGFVGLGIFVLMIFSCFWSLWRIRAKARGLPNGAELISYANMLELAILGFMVSGAFLGFVYLDVIYEMVGAVVALKVIFRNELRTSLASVSPTQKAILAVEPGELVASV